MSHNNMDKCSGGALGPLETWKQRIRDSTYAWTGGRGLRETIQSAKMAAREKAAEAKRNAMSKVVAGPGNDYSHVYRPKTWAELVRVSASVMGIEFCYAAETAYVSPTLLQIGVPHNYMTMIWCCSPAIGFFLTPLLGSLSDGCQSPMGRRRPFIVALALGAIIGLILVPNGVYIGEAFGENYDYIQKPVTGFNQTLSPYWSRAGMNSYSPESSGHAVSAGDYDEKQGRDDFSFTGSASMSLVGPKPGEVDPEVEQKKTSHFWGLLFTIIGVVLIDFCSDAAQSPARTYMLDVTTPDDQPKGLSTFTIMAGLGGSLGYLMGGVKWKETFFANFFRTDVQCLFALVLLIEIVCLMVTVTSFAEIPLDLLLTKTPEELGKILDESSYPISLRDQTMEDPSSGSSTAAYRTFNESAPLGRQCSNVIEKLHADDSLEMIPQQPALGGQGYQQPGGHNPFVNGEYYPADVTLENCPAMPVVDPHGSSLEGEPLTLQHYLESIVKMPRSLMMICLTNFFSWSSLVCYSLYFTDFVAENVFEGNPSSPEGSVEKELYHDGVRFGCYGMSLYSLSCSIYSMVIIRLVNRFRAKRVYVCGQLIYSLGMVILAITRSRFSAIVFSASAGIMYSTLFTMPYMLIAHYHATGRFVPEGHNTTAKIQARGLGTDLAIVSSMIFVAQFLLNLYMGPLMSACGTLIVVIAASIFAFLAAISATTITYLDL